MARATLRDGSELDYTVYDFTDPWTKPETIVMVHGFCRNSRFWFEWIPILARSFRVYCPDLRGCGKSPVPEPGFAWSLAQYHDDLIGFLDATGIERAHFVGESMGGMVMPYINSRSPTRIRSIVACSSNVAVRGAMAKEMAGGAANMTEAIKSAPTLVDYIRKTEGSRLAADEVSETVRAWYAAEWARTERRVWHEWSEMIVPEIDVTPELLRGIEHPLLFMGPSDCVKLSQDEARYWTTHAPRAELHIVQSRSQALAFAKANTCAQLTLGFLRKHSRGGIA